MDIISYALSKRYTEEVVDGTQYIRGANCEIQSIEEIVKDGVSGHRITWKWVGTSGNVVTDTMDVMDGYNLAQGYYHNNNFYLDTAHALKIIPDVDRMYLDKPTGSLYWWDGLTYHRCVAANDIQVTSLPTASAENLGAICQYTGASTASLIKGYFYECVRKGSTYSWEQRNVQPGSGQIDVMPAPSAERLGEVIQYTGSEPGFINGYFYVCVADKTTTPTTYRWEQKFVQPSSSEQVATMPEPNATNVGAVHQYVGATDSHYTNGYFYKCVEDSSQEPPVYSWVQINTQPGTDISYIQLPTPSGALSGVVALLTQEQEGYTVGTIYQCVYEDDEYIWKPINQAATGVISEQFINDLFN